jgi:MFS transporter, DHA1 family, multidrug resistance protein
MRMKLSSLRPDLPSRTVALSGGFFVLSVSYFMIVPLLALYMSTDLHTAPQIIGVVLAFFTVFSQGSQVFVGMLADRLGDRTVLTGGIVLVCIGYVGFASVQLLAAEIVCASALGLGNGIITVVGKAVLAAEAGEQRVSAFALRSVAVNLGAAAGPMAGGLLLGRFTAALYAAAVMHVLFWVVLIRPMPSRRNGEKARPPLLGQLRELFGNRGLIALASASVGFWYLYTQFTFTFPLYADDRFDMKGKVGLLFAMNAVLGVALQYLLVTRLSRRKDGWSILGTGLVFVAIAFLVLGLLPTVWGLVIFVVIFSLGELLVVPMLDVLAADIALSPTALAGSLGFASLGWMVGGLAGNLGGGALYQAAQHADHFGYFWTFNGLVGVLTALAFFLIRRRLRKPRTYAEKTTTGDAETART